MSRGLIVSAGFKVDLGALDRAAAGVDGTLDEVVQQPLSNIPHDDNAFGHALLASACSGFLSQWGTGIDNLAKDGREIAARLTANVQLYRRAEQANMAAIKDGVLAGRGSDPGEH
jgi:hypothetical protein